MTAVLKEAYREFQWLVCRGKQPLLKHDTVSLRVEGLGFWAFGQGVRARV